MTRCSAFYGQKNNITVHSNETLVSSVATVIIRGVLSYLKHCEDRIAISSSTPLCDVNTTYAMFRSYTLYSARDLILQSFWNSALLSMLQSFSMYFNWTSISLIYETLQGCWTTIVQPTGARLIITDKYHKTKQLSNSTSEIYLTLCV